MTDIEATTQMRERFLSDIEDIVDNRDLAIELAESLIDVLANKDVMITMQFGPDDSLDHPIATSSRKMLAASLCLILCILHDPDFQVSNH